MATVSACIMAKNEESMLPRCLESVKSWVDEIIFVDTGSTDKTVEIAESFGAKIYHHPWQNDFSLHRNQTIDYATGDWILIIDCDEEVASDMRHFKERLDLVEPEVAALVVTVREMGALGQSASWLSSRFFRRSSGIRYKYAVHNKATFKGGCGATDILFNHYGYSLTADRMEAKRKRTEALLLQRLESNPDDAIVYFYLTQMRTGQKRYKEAYDYGLEFFNRIKIAPHDFQYTSVMYFFMSWACLHLEDGNKAVDWAMKGLEFYPSDLDLHYIMARIGYQSRNANWLDHYGKRFLELWPKAMDRGVQGDGGFRQQLDPEAWYNRTVYTANEGAKLLIEESIKEGV